jgi:DNA-binding PadR family transcriptional regulator
MSIRYALLALLSAGPKCGLQLSEELEARPGEVWPPDADQVSAALQRLERDGLVVSAEAGADGPAPGFRITADGERELAGWLRTPPDLAVSPHAELTAKILVALRVPGTDVHEVVQAHRRHLVELMQHWTRVKQDEADDDLGLVLAVRAEIFRLDSVIRWLDDAGDRLEGAAASPPRLAQPALPRLRVRAGGPPGRANHQGTSGAIDDRIRTSDADRERVTARLRDHYAEGRLTRAELDERVTAALNARTFGDLRPVLADLPGPGPARQQARPLRPAARPRAVLGRRSLLVLPLAALALLGVLLIPAGGRPFAFLQGALLAAFLACAAAIIAARK